MKRVRLDSPHGRSTTEVLTALNVTLASGLSEYEAKQRLSTYGANEIGSRQRVGLISVLVHQFQSPVVALLAVAAAVAFYFREWEEGAAIVGVLILNAAIGFVTEIKAARSIEAIRALGSRSVRVLRGNQTRLISAEQLVPGDIVLLDAGDVISADLRVVESADLDADELTLTGEFYESVNRPLQLRPRTRCRSHIDAFQRDQRHAWQRHRRRHRNGDGQRTRSHLKVGRGGGN